MTNEQFIVRILRCAFGLAVLITLGAFFVMGYWTAKRHCGAGVASKPEAAPAAKIVSESVGQQVAQAMEWCSKRNFSSSEYVDMDDDRKPCDMLPYFAAGYLSTIYKLGYELPPNPAGAGETKHATEPQYQRLPVCVINHSFFSREEALQALEKFCPNPTGEER